MKSKELAKRFIESTDQKSMLVDIINEFGEEFKRLQKARNIKFDRGLIPIFRDMDNKYKSFASLVNKHYNKKMLKYTGFQIWLKQFYPIAYDYYISQK